MIAFIEEHREARGIEPTCRVLLIAPSTYYSYAAVVRDSGKTSDRSERDAETLKTIWSIHNESKGRFGAREVWHQLRRKDGGPAPMHRGAAHAKARIARSFARMQDNHDPRSG